MQRTYRFTYVQNKKNHVKHFDANSQAAAILDFELVTGLDMEKHHVTVARLDGAGVIQ